MSYLPDPWGVSLGCGLQSWLQAPICLALGFYCLVFFGYTSNIQGLLLALQSDTQEPIWDAGDLVWVGWVHSKQPPHYAIALAL